MDRDDGVPSRALVVGMGSTGEAVARRLGERGAAVVAVDDNPSDEVVSCADRLGIELVTAPDPAALAELAWAAELVVVSPGIPAGHPVFDAGAPVVSEVELAWRWARMPIVAVTGTNGKTTVTTLVTQMLGSSGLSAVAAGNIGTPMIDTVAGDADVVVAEVSSFQLALTDRFRPRVAVWLNIAEDHLDWHPSMAHYVAAKARIWANQAGDDLAVANADDPLVREASSGAPARLVSFGLHDGDYRESEGVLCGPGGEPIARVEDLPRSFPHDRSNALAAVAAAIGAGASFDACRSILLSFRGLPHRVELVGEAGGVKYYDDSKATTPASVLAALDGFDSVVLIAGGRNKGMRLSALRGGADRIRRVVAIGEAAGEIADAFRGVRPVTTVASMREAVREASAGALPGDSILLSPGCASFDWYGSYAERGADFARCVASIVAGAGEPG